MSKIDQDRLGVSSNQSQAASELGLHLSDRDYGRQKDQYGADFDAYSQRASAQSDAISRAMQGYELKLNAGNQAYDRQQDQLDRTLQLDDREWNRGMQSAEMEMTARTQAAEIAAQQAKAAADGAPAPFDVMKDGGAVAKAQARLGQVYGNEGLAALNIAQQVAGGGRAKTRQEFITMVVNAGQGANIKNQAVLIEAANELADMQGFGTTKAF
jgi:multidrug resistance efflux pump